MPLCSPALPRLVQAAYNRRCSHYQKACLMSVVSAPLNWVESVSELKLPARADRRLQQLMDRNTEGQLTPEERADLEELVELSEVLSLVRAEAFQLLGRKPE